MNHHLTESAISHQRREPVIKMIGAYCTDSSPMTSRHDKIKHKKKRPSFQSLEIPTGTIIVGNFFLVNKPIYSILGRTRAGWRFRRQTFRRRAPNLCGFFSTSENYSFELAKLKSYSVLHIASAFEE